MRKIREYFESNENTHIKICGITEAVARKKCIALNTLMKKNP
jgi:hypothetical protein